MNTGIASLAAVLTIGLGAAAMAQDQVKLFKVIIPKYDVTIGVTTTELKGFGTGADLDNLAHHLTADGQMTVWQYAVRHGKDGSLEMAPLRRVAIFQERHAADRALQHDPTGHRAGQVTPVVGQFLLPIQISRQDKPSDRQRNCTCVWHQSARPWTWSHN
jgi:hypothetical protein